MILKNSQFLSEERCKHFLKDTRFLEVLHNNLEQIDFKGETVISKKY